MTVSREFQEANRVAHKSAPAQKSLSTKKQLLIKLLARRKGADINQLSRALGWLPHSVRAALVHLANTGVEVERLPNTPNSPQRYRVARDMESSKIRDATPLTRKIGALQHMTRQELLSEWARAIGDTTPSGLSVSIMRRALGYHLQCAEHGGLSRGVKRALGRAAARNTAQSGRGISLGARLVREWNGVNHVVDVVDGGFLYKDRRYRSLSAIAIVITGARWSGPRFFGLKARSDR